MHRHPLSERSVNLILFWKQRRRNIIIHGSGQGAAHDTLSIYCTCEEENNETGDHHPYMSDIVGLRVCVLIKNILYQIDTDPFFYM